MKLVTRPCRGLLLVALLCAASETTHAADAWKTLTAATAPGLPADEIHFLTPARAGGVWVGTSKGVARFHNGKFEPLVADGKPLECKPWWLLEQADGALWIGHEGGALRLAAQKREDHLRGQQVAPIFEVGGGQLWAIGKAGGRPNQLHRFHNGAWSPVAGSENLRIEDMLRARDGRLWLILEGDGVLAVDPAVGLEKATRHLSGMSVTAVFEDRDGKIWCGLWTRGVTVWNGTTWQPTPLKAPESAVLDIQQDSTGQLWVATSANGVFRGPADGSAWRQDLGKEGSINLIAPDRDGRVWVSSQMTGGLRYWNGERWSVSLASPLPIRCFLHAADGVRLAGGVLDGLHVLPKQ